MSVSGLTDGAASYSNGQINVFGGLNSGTVALDATNVDDGMFVASAFTGNHSVSNPSPTDSNTSYTSVYHTGVGSAGGSFGYISSFDSNKANLSYVTGHTGSASNAIAYAAWKVVAVPEPSHVSVVIALLTTCFCAVRRRVA